VSILDNEMPQDQGDVFLEQKGGVAWITLSRPSALNSLTWKMYGQLEEYLHLLESDDSVRVLVVRGDGDKALAAGTDIQQFREFTSAGGVLYEERIDRIMDLLGNLPIPTIAAVQGYAVGGGFVLAAACDLRYATPDARLGAPMAKTLGNCLSYDNYQRLAQSIGSMRVKELLYTARLLDAEEASSIGFLTAIFPKSDFFEQVGQVAKLIAVNAPLTVWATKRAFLPKGRGTVSDGKGFEDVVKKVYGSSDFAEGVQAYLEKRAPVWGGR